MKDAGLHRQIQRNLREKFLEVCQAQDQPAAQVLREFMRGYVAQHDTTAHDVGKDSDDVTSERTGTGTRQG